MRLLATLFELLTETAKAARPLFRGSVGWAFDTGFEVATGLGVASVAASLGEAASGVFAFFAMETEGLAGVELLAAAFFKDHLGAASVAAIFVAAFLVATECRSVEKSRFLRDSDAMCLGKG